MKARHEKYVYKSYIDKNLGLLVVGDGSNEVLYFYLLPI